MKRKKGWLPVFLLPAVALFLLIYAVPLVIVFVSSLTLTTQTAEKAEKNGAALGNVEYTLTITNTSDGTVSTIVGRTNSSGTDSKT